MKKTLLKTYLNSRWDYYLFHPWEFFIDLYKEIRDFIQRGLYGYGEAQTWGINWYIATILPEMLREMASFHCGHPVEFVDDPEDTDRWGEILIEIAEGFEAYTTWEDRAFEEDLSKEDFQKAYDDMEKKLNNSLDLMKKWYGNLWD